MGFTVRSLSAVYQKLPPENVSLWRRVYSEQPPADAATLITLTNVDPSVLGCFQRVSRKQEMGFRRMKVKFFGCSSSPSKVRRLCKDVWLTR